MKIMLVDDSRTVRNILKNVLARLGHTEISEASDGLEALQLLQQDRPDLVLMDWYMPNMDGITLVREIRSKDQELPLIMCTTEAEKSRVLHALKAGVNNYIVKPFSSETLSEKIQQTMDKAKDAAGSAADSAAG